MLVICPNCKKEFIIGDELFGECPNCHIKLMFRGENELIEKVDIKEIEKKVDEITSEVIEINPVDKLLIDEIGREAEKKISYVEKKVDEIIG
ncbi:MAG TPA: hypothetical protein ENL42_00190 [Thermoplasmatales archaeon]|nr:hypothetical protein [Thermoplasmatales archaeon]